jgi:hypothetical protein
MGLEPRFTPADIRKKLEEAVVKIDKAIIANLRYLGEECVNHARTSGDYNNVTGNLRNSIGYVIVKDGQIVKRDFKRTASVTNAKGKKTKGSQEGAKIGQALAEQLASKAPKGYVLIVVAGMVYASKVESNGRNVLSSAENYAKSQLPGIMRQLKAQIARMK